MGEKRMNRSIFVFICLLPTVVLPAVLTEAQQPTKIPRIGYLSPNSRSSNPARIEAFRQGLHELGYVEGKNIVIESRDAEGKLDRLSQLAAELVRLKVDIIVTSSPAPTRAAKQATVTIPIVFAQDGDPVASGFVASLARPGGNITGLSTLAPELSGKRLELLKEVVPKLSRVAVLGTSTSPSTAPTLKETELAAGASKVQLQYLDVLDPKDIETAFRTAAKRRADAVLVLAGPVVFSQRTEIAGLAVKSRLPAIYPQTEFTEAGGLMYYGANTPDMYRRAATFVDKILKGAKPADLPVEQPTKFELVINLTTAKRIGLTIPPNLLARADKVIR
jgi:putative tryptophan/tyrosine transport system substrate-binding protein